MTDETISITCRRSKTLSEERNPLQRSNEEEINNLTRIPTCDLRCGITSYQQTTGTNIIIHQEQIQTIRIRHRYNYKRCGEHVLHIQGTLVQRNRSGTD